jgi:hypothetical protein
MNEIKPIQWTSFITLAYAVITAQHAFSICRQEIRNFIREELLRTNRIEKTKTK